MGRKALSVFGPLAVLMLALGVWGCAKPAVQSDESKADAAVSEDVGPGGVLDSDSGTALGLQSIYFDYRGFEAKGSEQDKLKANARILRANARLMVQLEGHCDQRGGDAINFELGEKRAQWVRRALVSQGVSAERLSPISYGKTHLATPAADDPERGKNRRVNFVLLTR